MGKNKFYLIVQVGYDSRYHINDIEAKSWEEAKHKAFPFMDIGDALAECSPASVVNNQWYPGYYRIDKDECAHYAVLRREVDVTWGACKYADDRVWYFDDAPDVYLDKSGLPFTDWRDDGKYDWREVEKKIENRHEIKVMIKTDTLDAGLMAMCDASYSISDCLDNATSSYVPYVGYAGEITYFSPVCECKSCMEMGMEEIERRKAYRRDWFKTVTLQQMYDGLLDVVKSDEDEVYSNGIWDLENGFRYCTSGGICFAITLRSDGLYDFSVSRVSGDFINDSKLKKSLEDHGFELIRTHGA